MCGLSGFCDFNKKSEEDELKNMTRVLYHRGPDDMGIDFIDNEYAQIGLGHRRLSILELSLLGHQPMKFQNLTIIFNGEIYNFKEIKIELEKLNYTFDSNSDTELILKAFYHWGTEAIHQFIGMFAFVIYDNQKQKLYLFRDRAGVKPLYYYWKDGLLLFASELKSFHEKQNFTKELCLDSLSLYLQYGYVPAPYSIFNYTYKLLPGHYIEVNLKNKILEEKKYWDVNDLYNLPKLNISEEEAILETEKLLKSSFNYRMVSDVPVGVFLSGGYDSSAVAALLQTEQSQKIKTFSIGFENKKFDEAPYAKQVADFLGTDHTEYYCTAKEAAAIIPTLPDIFDEPFADNSTVPTTLVSKLAREQVKVALSADGGDEIFGGYTKFEMASKYTNIIPHVLQSILGAGMGLINPEHIPYFNKKYNFATRYEKIRNIWAANNEITTLKIIAQFFTDKELKQILSQYYDQGKTFFDDEIKLNDQNDSLNKMLAVDYKTFLLDNNLTKVDRATMSVSLEGRDPLLDHRIIEFVSRLPSHYKIKNGQKKALLKSIVHRHIPAKLMERPKMGFLAPLVDWFRKELQELFYYYLGEERLRKGNIFNVQEVIKLRDSYLAGNQENVQKLWHILMFEMWREKWLD